MVPQTWRVAEVTPAGMDHGPPAPEGPRVPPAGTGQALAGTGSARRGRQVALLCRAAAAARTGTGRDEPGRDEPAGVG